MLARRSLLLFIVNVTNSFLGFLSTVVIARWMGASALGTVSYFLGMLGMLGVLLDMGFAFAHLKRVSETQEDPGPLIGTYLVLKAALAAVYLIGVLLLPVVNRHLGLPFLGTPEEHWIYYITALFYVLHSLSGIFLFTFEARLQTAKQSLAAFAGSLTSFVAKAAVAVFGLGVVALAAAYVVEPVVLVLAGALLFGSYRITRPGRAHFRSYLHYTLPLVLNNAIGLISSNLNPVLLGWFWSSSEVGYYSSVLGFGSLLDHVASAVGVLFLPKASSDAGRGDLSEIRRRVSVIEHYVLMVLTPLSTLVIFFRHEVVNTAYGPGFSAAASVLAFIALNSLISAVFSPYRLVLLAIERQRQLVVGSLLGLLTLLGVNALLTPAQWRGMTLAGLGGGGAALAIVGMTIASGIFQVRTVRRSTGIGFYWKSCLFLLAGGVMYSAMYASRPTVPLPTAARMLCLTGIGFAAYLAVLVLLRQFTRVDVEVFLNMIHPQRMVRYISDELGSRE